jgi:hypothetical protein
VNHHNTLTAGGADRTLTLPQKKGAGQRNKPHHRNPSKQVQQKDTSKVGQLVDYKADLPNLRTACKLKEPYSSEGGVDQAATAERQKNKTPLTSQSLGKTTTELLLICQYQDWMLEE